MIDEKGAALLHRIHGDGRIAGAPADATKGFGVVAVGLGSDELAVGGKTPKVSAAGTEVGASEGAKGTDQLAGIVVMKSSPGKLQKELLESFVRLRRVAGTRISGMGSQCAPTA